MVSAKSPSTNVDGSGFRALGVQFDANAQIPTKETVKSVMPVKSLRSSNHNFDTAVKRNGQSVFPDFDNFPMCPTYPYTFGVDWAAGK